MIDPAMLTPATSSTPKTGLGVLSATPQSAKAFAEEFGSALRTMKRHDRKAAGERPNTPPSASAARTPERAPANHDRVTGGRQDTPAPARDSRQTVSANEPTRTQVDTLGSNDIQVGTTEADSADAPAVDETTEQKDTPQADQAVDALKTLLTKGAIAPADADPSVIPAGLTPTEAAMPDAPLAALDSPVSTISTDEPITKPHADHAIDAASEEGVAQPIASPALVEAAPGSAEVPLPAAPSTTPTHEGAATLPEAGEPAGSAEPAPMPGGSANAAPVQDQGAQEYGPGATDAATATRTPRAQPGMTDAGQGAGTSIPPVAEPADTQAGADTGEAPASSTSEDAALLETPDAAQADTNAEQGDQPLPQQHQPAQPASAKAESNTPQSLIGGVPTPGQATNVASPIASGVPQGQQQGQPTQTPTLTPAQQLASAMGALRRRGDGSYMTEITLNPKELGQVRLQVHVAGNTVSMQATALDPATRALLNTGLDDLSQALVDAGLESGHLDVSQGDGQTGDGTANDQPFAGFGDTGVQVIEEEDLTMAGASADYITSTSVNTLA